LPELSTSLELLRSTMLQRNRLFKLVQLRSIDGATAEAYFLVLFSIYFAGGFDLDAFENNDNQR
jgi:hypothetical protein